MKKLLFSALAIAAVVTASVSYADPLKIVYEQGPSFCDQPLQASQVNENLGSLGIKTFDTDDTQPVCRFTAQLFITQ